MSLEDRDWYRDSFAKKTGRAYNAKDATYTPLLDEAVADESGKKDPRYDPKLFRGSAQVQRPVSEPPRLHPALLVFYTAMLSLAVYAVLKLLSKFL